MVQYFKARGFLRHDVRKTTDKLYNLKHNECISANHNSLLGKTKRLFIIFFFEIKFAVYVKKKCLTLHNLEDMLYLVSFCIHL